MAPFRVYKEIYLFWFKELSNNLKTKEEKIDTGIEPSEGNDHSHAIEDLEVKEEDA